MGIFTLASLGTVPFGSVLYYGLIAKYFGERTAFTGGAIIFTLVLLAFIIINNKLRRHAAPLLIANQVITTASEVIGL